jgi:hypothetical protein
MSRLRALLRLATLSTVLAGVGVASAEAAAASQALYERTLMQAADARCHLFAPPVSRALEIARAEARNAALRAGDTVAAIDGTEQRAQARAGATPCSAPGLKLAADRVRQAYAAYAQRQVMTFPGPQAAWRAERPYPNYKGPPRWSLLQVPLGQGGWLLFGKIGGVVTALDARRGATPAATARLLVRDPNRLATPYLPGGRVGLAAQAPPRDVTQAFLARGRYAAKPSLWPAGAKGATAYQFGPDALAALAALDPRETATLELVYPTPTGERTVDAWIEVGDLAAALAFLDLGPPHTP